MSTDDRSQVSLNTGRDRTCPFSLGMSRPIVEFMNRIVGCIWLTGLFVVFASCGTSPLALSDSAAKETFMHSIKDPARGFSVLPLGRLSVVSSGHEGVFQKNQISQDAFARYQNLQTNGLVTISQFRDLAHGGFQGWDSFYALSQQGVIKQFTAQATANALGLICPESILKLHAMPPAALCINKGKLESAIITQNRLFASGSNSFRVVRGLYEWFWDPQFLKTFTPNEGSFKRERKFAMLLKFDPFKSSWSFIELDEANHDEDFPFQGVEKATAGMTAVSN